jgi:predicted ATPase
VSIHLPTPLTRFVGRQAELAQAAALLAEDRLLTLTGPGGAGKTRLALRLASAVAEDFPDGVWFVDLAALSDGQFVWDQVATALGVKEPGPGGTFAEAVSRHLADRRALVVLDNCEHLVESAAEVTGALLAAAPDLKVVATSREPLGVDGEVTWTVPPLSEGDGLGLFVARARQARPQLRRCG